MDDHDADSTCEITSFMELTIPAVAVFAEISTNVIRKNSIKTYARAYVNEFQWQN